MEQPTNATAGDATLRPPVLLVWGIFAVWITFFTGQFIELFRMRPSWHFALAFIGTIAFFALYLITAMQIAQRLTSDAPEIPPTRRQVWTPIIAMILLSAIMTLIAGPDWGGLFIYTSAISAAHLPVKRSVWIIGGLALFSVGGTWLTGHDLRAVFAALFTILVTGFTTVAMRWAFITNRELRRARQELAQLAVTEERLRFARDLHDLLGHTLSLIALKSELAGRLVRLVPDRAAVEIGDVEAAARLALHEVREAVAGYRQPTLAGELQAAHEMLDAAGIALTLDAAPAPLPLRSTVEGMLAWTVREAVTNVIRHSHARHCAITVAYSMADKNVRPPHVTGKDVSPSQGDTVRLTVSDDGQREPADGGACEPGNGLRGIAERADALGGTCEAALQEAGGFRLAVTLPIAAPRKRAATVRVREEIRS